MITSRKPAVAFLLGPSLVTGAPAVGDEDDEAAEHEAFQKTTIALATAIVAAEAQTHARAISAEFARDDGEFIYEVELLASDGTKLEAEVDAQTATVLDVEAEDEDGDEGNGCEGDDD